MWTLGLAAPPLRSCDYLNPGAIMGAPAGLGPHLLLRGGETSHGGELQAQLPPQRALAPHQGPQHCRIWWLTDESGSSRGVGPPALQCQDTPPLDVIERAISHTQLLVSSRAPAGGWQPHRPPIQALGHVHPAQTHNSEFQLPFCTHIHRLALPTNAQGEE